MMHHRCIIHEADANDIKGRPVLSYDSYLSLIFIGPATWMMQMHHPCPRANRYQGQIPVTATIQSCISITLIITHIVQINNSGMFFFKYSIKVIIFVCFICHLLYCQQRGNRYIYISLFPYGVGGSVGMFDPHFDIYIRGGNVTYLELL